MMLLAHITDAWVTATIIPDAICCGSRQADTRSIVHGPDLECPLNVCAVTRRRFPVGASPTRQPLQPEATGAVMEVTKWLKPSV